MRHTRNHRRAARFPILPCTGMGLSSPHCYLWSGELLPPLFTLTSGKPEAVIFCDTIRHARLPSRAPAFTGNPALRCPDFPLIPERTSERPHAKVDPRTLRHRATTASGKFKLIQCQHKRSVRQAPRRRGHHQDIAKTNRSTPNTREPLNPDSPPSLFLQSARGG
jgi:hypothetical protein